jgi:hypothetical protein
MRVRLPDLLGTRVLPAAVPAAAALLGVTLAVAGSVRWWQADASLAAARVSHEAAAMLARGGERSSSPRTDAAASRSRGRERGAAAAGDPGEAERITLARFLSVDWNRRLLQVERGSAGAVSLLGLRVDAQRGLIELRGEVDSLERLERFQARLLAAGVDSVQVQRHERVNRPTGSRLAFVATAEWTR